MTNPQATIRYPVPRLVPAFDIAAKTLLVLLMLVAAISPATVNLEDKAATARAIGYPLLAFALPVTWLAFWRDRHPFPWVADLMLTIPCFSDTLGNRMNLYDRIWWFDDLVHFVNTGLLAAGFLMLTMRRTATLAAMIERGLAAGVTAALAWEIAEYFAFLSRHTSSGVYADTLADMALGTTGILAAVLLLHRYWQRTPVDLPEPPIEIEHPTEA